jgi:hypothetical protein
MPCRRLVPLTLLFLVACGTPQERCIARETRDLRAVDRQIAEAEGNLARGYALVEVTVYEDYWDSCIVPPDPPPPADAPPPPVVVRPCLKERAVTETRPKRIDLNAERQRLAGLQAQRRSLARAADGAVARCRAAFPQG